MATENPSAFKQTGLLVEQHAYKPFRYPWAYDFWKKQQQVHWLADEVPMADDVSDWDFRLTDEERALLTQIFRFFTQADVEVNNCYHRNYLRVFKPTEVVMMLSAFSNMETVHVDAYSHLLETIGMPETEYSAFLEYKEMRDKADFLRGFNPDTAEGVALTLATFGSFVEGLQLFASFAMLMNFPRQNKMKGMGQIVSWSVRDETLHMHGVNRLYHTFVQEQGDFINKAALNERILEAANQVIAQEDAFIRLAFSAGGISGLSVDEMQAYIRYIANRRLGQLGLEGGFDAPTRNPLPWMDDLINGVEHANFFEQRATEYSKGATTGDWSEIW